MERRCLYTRPIYHLWRGQHAWCGKFLSHDDGYMQTVGPWLDCPAQKRCPGCVLAHSRDQMLLYSPAELALAEAAHAENTGGAKGDM